MDLLPLKTITRQKIYQDNLIVGRQRDVAFLVDGNNFRVIFTLGKKGYRPSIFLKVKISDHYLWVSLEELPSMGYFSEELRVVELEALPNEIQPIILESVSNHVCDVIEEELGVVLSFEEFKKEVPEEIFEQELQFLVSINGARKKIRGALHMGMHTFEFIVALMERFGYLKKKRFGSVDVPVHAIMGMEPLSLRDFKKLKAGDIILLNDRRFFDEGYCRIVLGGKVVYGGIFEAGKITLGEIMDEKMENEDFLEESEETMGEKSEKDIDLPEKDVVEAYEEELFESEEESNIPEEMDEILINLVFEVGQKRIALGDLQTLKPGYIFELENPADMPVTIRANGKKIGKGELLKVPGDRVGVRVTSFK